MGGGERGNRRSIRQERHVKEGEINKEGVMNNQKHTGEEEERRRGR